MSTYLNDTINEMVNYKPEPLPPALLPIEQQYKDHLTAAVNDGLEPDNIMNMHLIMMMCLKQGLSVEDLQGQQVLFTNLMLETNFSTTDVNINRMVNLIQAAQQNR